MDFLSLLLKVKDFLLNLLAFVLKKFGYKIVKSEDYNNEEVEVGNNYPELSPKCIEEKIKEHNSIGLKKCIWAMKNILR